MTTSRQLPPWLPVTPEASTSTGRADSVQPAAAPPEERETRQTPASDRPTAAELERALAVTRLAR